jgi:hypothetical protein
VTIDWDIHDETMTSAAADAASPRHAAGAVLALAQVLIDGGCRTVSGHHRRPHQVGT